MYKAIYTKLSDWDDSTIVWFYECPTNEELHAWWEQYKNEFPDQLQGVTYSIFDERGHRFV